jgi:hypothetical protein
MTSRAKAAIRTTLRRVAAKILNAYEPPSLAHSDELVQELDAALQRGGVDGEWAAFTVDIAGALRSSGADRFLRLPPIAKTLHPRIRSHTRSYLTYLLQSGRFSPALHKALTESPVGQPLLNPQYPLSSPLLVQHGYHLLRLLEATSVDLTTLRLVVDFGGGYGSFFRLLRNLNYERRYIICDLPVMCALQRFYLRNVFPTGPSALPPANLQWVSSETPEALQRETAQHNPSLFIATWSLSETPPSVRAAIAAVLGGFSYILCAYQRAFGAYDNVQYFESLQRRLPQFDWQHDECPVYRNNFYLIGQRRLTA